MRSAFRDWMLLFVLLAALLACKKGKSYPDGEEGLKQLGSDFLSADESDGKKLGEGLKLPKPAEWFSATFGPELGAKLAADYDAEAAKLATIRLFFVAGKAKGRTEVRAFKLTSPESGDANMYQIQAIRGMKQPTALYTLQIVAPGEDSGSTLWSFAHVDGSFRYVGKLKAANPSPGPLDEFRKSEVLKALKEKGGE